MRKGIIANMLPRGENRPSGWAAVRLMMGELIPQDNRMGKGGVLPESHPESQHTGHRPLQPGLLKPILSASLWVGAFVQRGENAAEIIFSTGS